jgi:hypothetical protein
MFAMIRESQVKPKGQASDAAERPTAHDAAPGRRTKVRDTGQGYWHPEESPVGANRLFRRPGPVQGPEILTFPRLTRERTFGILQTSLR